MKNNIKAFTLVELIVVITILAILGTVAFLSFQEYTTLARNSVRIDGISKISSAVKIKKQSGLNILGFANTGQEVTNAQIGGTSVAPGLDYQAGSINARALEMKSDAFIDPRNEKLFSIGVTTKKGGQYEVIATLEEAGSERAKIVGTYQKRESEILTGTGILGQKTFLLSNQGDINKLLKGDIVTGVGINTETEIIRVSADGLTISLSDEFASNSNAIQLGSNETDGMVISVDGTTPVTEGSNNVAYKVLN